MFSTLSSTAANANEAVKESRKSLNEAMKRAYEGRSTIQNIAEAAGLSKAEVERVVKGMDLSWKNVSLVVKALAQQKPLRLTTYSAVAKALGRKGQGAIAVAKALATKGKVTPLEGAVVLTSNWRNPDYGGYIVPFEEPDWDIIRGSSCSRYNVLSDRGIDVREGPDSGHYLIPDDQVITIPKELRLIAGLD
ncbi:MAG: HU family DNA-binding protein [Bifidobacteriales bacterium]|nr:HU family DNA-binding protein [Bifidobacteriales bacterium]